MAYILKAWSLGEIDIEFDEEACQGSIVTIRVATQDAILLIMGEIFEDGDMLKVTQAHITSIGVRPNDVGVANLRQVARAVMEKGVYGEIVVQGAFRTTWSQPGRRPSPMRFARDALAHSQRPARRREDD